MATIFNRWDVGINKVRFHIVKERSTQGQEYWIAYRARLTWLLGKKHKWNRLTQTITYDSAESCKDILLKYLTRYKKGQTRLSRIKVET